MQETDDSQIFYDGYELSPSDASIISNLKVPI